MAADQLRFALGVAENRRLFSENFLRERLPELPGFARSDSEPLRLHLLQLWEREAAGLANANEAQTEERFIRPCLRALGFDYTVQTDLRFAGGRRQPDYALFLNREDREQAEALEGVGRYQHAVAVADAKRFDRPLDVRGRKQALSDDPVAQIITYVQATRCPWGVLTNGRVWRLYALEGDLVEAASYDVDLVELLEGGDQQAFRYFSAFFSADSFRPGSEGQSFLDLALADGTANSRRLGQELERQIFSAVPLIAQGLMRDEEPTEDSLAEAFENSLVLLYRLLFCLYAEARELLPVNEHHYFRYSVREQKERLAAEIEGGARFSDAADELYNELRALFRMIDRGDPRLGVNEYDGGLFAADGHPYLEGRYVPDSLFAPALDGLYRVDRRFVDYRSLSVRHLGDIYERLLEFRLVADAEKGLILEHSEGRRDAGAYFTPEAVVDMIVERTLDPLLARLSSEVQERRLAGDDVLEAFLELRVLDPAMGSGHFLVSAGSYIADWIATDPSYGGSLDRDGIRRLVAERCLYGVDLNPMAVELARLSLWLTTVSGDEPLTFLSNLRCGNSLVGADVAELLAGEDDIFAASLAREAEGLLGRVGAIAALPSDSGERVHEKERLAAAAAALRDPLEAFADKTLSAQFTSGPVPFFHWEIEFPEVFLTPQGRLRADGGFHAIIGNPPYIRIQALGRDLARYARSRYETARGSFDAYIVFFERSLELLGPGGRLGFITPNKFMKLDAGSALRQLFADQRLVEEIIDFGDMQVFPGATNYTAIVTLDRAGARQLTYSRPDRPADPSEIVRVTDRAETESYDVENLGSGPWVLVAGEEAEVLQAARRESEPLGELVQGIFTGLQTGADKIYILRDLGAVSGGRRVHCAQDDREYILEPDLLHALASGVDVDRYSFRPLDSLLLFPYRRIESGMRLLTDAELEALPRTREYLLRHEATLRGRERCKMDHDAWPAYTYPKSLGLHDLPKLGVAATVRRLEVAADPAGAVYFHNVRVNGILPLADGVSLWPLLVLLNSRLLDYVFRRGSVPHANGFFAANKQFIAPLPIRAPESDLEGSLGAIGKRLYERGIAMADERAGFLRWLSGHVGTAVESLPGRTAITAYASADFEAWLALLRRALAGGDVNPERRSFREAVEAEWISSSERLRSLEADQLRDERSADDLVFDLYELPTSLRRVVDAEYEDVGTG